MNQEKRNTVNDRLGVIFGNEIEVLYFSDWDEKNIFNKNPFDGMSLIDSIIECLSLNKEFCSTSQKGGLETDSNCNRSVIDIWRHLKYYNPELTIFEVMSCLYEYIMSEDEEEFRISTFICPNIGRRVFILDDTSYYVSDTQFADALHIDFHEWNNI